MSLETNQNDLVVVALSAVAGTDDVTLLNSYNGVRVYDRRHVDPRVTMGEPIPHFRTWGDCETYLHKDSGKTRPCLLDLDVAKRVFSEVPFAEPVPAYTPVEITEDHEDAKDRLIRAYVDQKGIRLTSAEVALLVEGWL